MRIIHGLSSEIILFSDACWSHRLGTVTIGRWNAGESPALLPQNLRKDAPEIAATEP